MSRRRAKAYRVIYRIRPGAEDEVADHFGVYATREEAEKVAAHRRALYRKEDPVVVEVVEERG